MKQKNIAGGDYGIGMSATGHGRPHKAVGRFRDCLFMQYDGTGKHLLRLLKRGRERGQWSRILPHRCMQSTLVLKFCTFRL